MAENPITYELTEIPDGFEFDVDTLRQLGIPTTEGTHNQMYTATDIEGTAETLEFDTTIEALPQWVGIGKVGDHFLMVDNPTNRARAHNAQYNRVAASDIALGSGIYVDADSDGSVFMALEGPTRRLRFWSHTGSNQLPNEYRNVFEREDVQTLLPVIFNDLKTAEIIDIPATIDLYIALINAGSATTLQAVAQGQGITLTDEHIILLSDPDVQAFLLDDTVQAMFESFGDVDDFLSRLASSVSSTVSEGDIYPPSCWRLGRLRDDSDTKIRT